MFFTASVFSLNKKIKKETGNRYEATLFFFLFPFFSYPPHHHPPPLSFHFSLTIVFPSFTSQNFFPVSNKCFIIIQCNVNYVYGACTKVFACICYGTLVCMCGDAVKGYISSAILPLTAHLKCEIHTLVSHGKGPKDTTRCC